MRISGAEVNAVPFLRPGEALEVVPGLIVTQHSGEGKANQYFLRGFNLDHGTDLSIKVDGMPVNMPTHGHGQGYADINFLIPELIQSVYVRKGPYYADVGDFSSAGSVEIDYLNKPPKNLAEVTVGSFGYRRGLAVGSTAVGAGTLLSAIEGVKYNGPWDVPDNVRKINGVMRYSQGTATDGLTLTAMAYSNAWNSTDQVAQRAIDQGIIGRFGTLDPTDGGVASRFSLSGNFAHSSEYGQSKISAYVVRSDLQLYNNFTYFLDNPVNGDQFNQLDRRTLGGFDARHAFDWRLGGLETQTRVGLQSRYDDIHVGLFKTEQRALFSTVREDRVQEGNVGVWTDTTTRWTDWLRSTVGIREDIFAGRVLSDTPENSGNAQATITSPKAGIVLGPWYKTEFYGNAGYGLHSNDIRGATITVDPIDKVTPQDRVPLLVRSKGAELGIRTKAIEGLTSSVAVFVLDFDFRTAVRRRCRHHRGQPAQPPRRRGVDQQVQAGVVADVRSGCCVYPRPLYRFRSRGRSHPRCAGLDCEWCGHLRQRDWLVRRAEGTLFRSASADRGRQRSFPLIPDLQCARRLPVRQRPAAAARRAESLQREDQPDRILLSVAITGRADRRRCRPPRSSRRTAGGSPHVGGSFLIALCRLLCRFSNMPRRAYDVR